MDTALAVLTVVFIVVPIAVFWLTLVLRLTNKLYKDQ